MASSPFESYSIIDEYRPVICKKNVIVASSGYVFGINGGEVKSYHRGYRNLDKELQKFMLFHSIRYGVNFSQFNSSAILFHNAWSSGYYHWLIEALPRLIAMKESWSNKHIIAPSYPPNLWFAKWLYSISGGRYIKSSKRPILLSECSFQENPESMSSFSRPDLFLTASYFRQLFLREKSFAEKKLKIYISRKSAGHRKISNEESVIQILEKKGYKTLELEKIPFLDQVGLFMNASHVVSIHGAGLSNILFMCPGAQVIEFLQQPDRANTWGKRRETHYLNPCFKALSEVMGLEYSYLLCDYDEESTPDSVVKKYGALHGNINVNLDKLISIVDAVS